MRRRRRRRRRGGGDEHRVIHIQAAPVICSALSNRACRSAAECAFLTTTIEGKKKKVKTCVDVASLPCSAHNGQTCKTQLRCRFAKATKCTDR